MAARASRMGRSAGLSATEEIAVHKLAHEFSLLLGSYIDPYTLKLHPAVGYWTHTTQDVMRFTGTFTRPNLGRLTYDFGSWDITISQIAKGYRFAVDDERKVHRADAAFMIRANPKLPQSTASNGEEKTLRDLADMKERICGGYLAGVAPHLTPEDLRRKADALAQSAASGGDTLTPGGATS